MSSSPNKPALKLDWCSHEAARWAVEHWHYSKSMPTPPVARIGAWENERFIGVVLFSRGANNNLGKPYQLSVTEVCELTRVALSSHDTPVSKIVSLAIKMLQKQSSGLRLVVSFADQNHGHVGVIYQAGGWIYSGTANSTPKYITKGGKVLHNRQVSKTGFKPQYGELRRVPLISDCQIVPQLDKHRYLYPLDRAMRKQIEPLRKPYPKRQTCGPSVEGDMPPQAEGVVQSNGAAFNMQIERLA